MRLICALGLYLFCARGLHGMRARFARYVRRLVRSARRFARYARRFARLARAVRARFERLLQGVEQLDGAFCMYGDCEAINPV